MKEGEDGWFTGKVPTWVNSLIVNGNDGSVQTEDISIEGKELWLTVYKDLTYDLSYEDPNKAVEDVTVRRSHSVICRRAAQGEAGTDEIFVNRKSRRKTVQHRADLRPVALAEQGDAKAVPKGVLHAVPPFRIASSAGRIFAQNAATGSRRISYSPTRGTST